jgi:hypothetical protein
MLDAFLPIILALAPSASPALSVPGPLLQDSVPPIQADGDNFIINFPEGERPQDGMNLGQFVRACQLVTEINFTYDDQTKQLLSAKPITLLGTKIVPKKDFYSFFQIILFINDFVTTKVGEGALAVIQIEALAGAGGRAGTPRADGILVEE